MVRQVRDTALAGRDFNSRKIERAYGMRYRMRREAVADLFELRSGTYPTRGP
jgi:hypothetical protein